MDETREDRQRRREALAAHEESRIAAVLAIADGHRSRGQRRLPTLCRRQLPSGGWSLISQGRVIYWSDAPGRLDQVVAGWYRDRRRSLASLRQV